MELKAYFLGSEHFSEKVIISIYFKSSLGYHDLELLGLNFCIC